MTKLIIYSLFVSVNPIYYVTFTTATIVASIILFQGFSTEDAASAISLLAGFSVTFIGVHLLNLSRTTNDAIPATAIAPLEAVVSRRMSLSGRPSSIDGGGWGFAGGVGGVLGGAGLALSDIGPDGALRSAGHGRRSSLYRMQSSTLFSAFEDGEEDAGHHSNGALPRLREEDEDEDDDDGVEADERTRLRNSHAAKAQMQRQNSRTNGMSSTHHRGGSRSGHSSPLQSGGARGTRGSPV